jgi:hypothetical protein
MNDERVSSAKRVPSKEFQRRDPLQAIPRLDRDRAISELNRFLGLAMGEMNLALEYQIVVSAKAEAGRDDADLAVTFSGADQELLLEKEAELLLALEHIAHRWLRLDPRLHDRVRFDCGDIGLNWKGWPVSRTRCAATRADSFKSASLVAR